MTVDLSPETAQLVQQAVSTGEFRDAAAMIEAVVHGWNAQRDELFGFTPEEIARLWDDGIASGPGSMNLEEIQREAFRRAGVPSAER